jgi:hypothetical protein
MADRPGFWLLTRAVTARATMRTAVSALAPARAGGGCLLVGAGAE